MGLDLLSHDADFLNDIRAMDEALSRLQNPPPWLLEGWSPRFIGTRRDEPLGFNTGTSQASD